MEVEKVSFTSSYPLMLFHILLPAIFILGFEYFLFFHHALKDVDKAKQNYFLALKADLKQKVGSLPPNTQDLTALYIQNVHRSSKHDYDEHVAEQKKYRTKMERRGQALFAALAIMVLILGVRYRKDIDWKSVVIQAVGTVSLLIAFQYYFYNEVSKKYKFVA